MVYGVFKLIVEQLQQAFRCDTCSIDEESRDAIITSTYFGPEISYYIYEEDDDVHIQYFQTDVAISDFPKYKYVGLFFDVLAKLYKANVNKPDRELLAYGYNLNEIHLEHAYGTWKDREKYKKIYKD